MFLTAEFVIASALCIGIFYLIIDFVMYNVVEKDHFKKITKFWEDLKLKTKSLMKY